MKYLIGDVAAITGLSIEGIRKYERAGIISPERSENAQYRLYSYLDITSMMRTQFYRSLGFSLREIADLINNDDLPTVISRFQARLEELDQDSRILAMKQRFLQEKIDELSDAESSLDRIVISPSPAFFRLEFAKNGEITKSKERIELCRKWMDYLPFMHISTRYNGEDTYGGLSIQEPYADLFHVEENSCIKYYPSRPGLQICVLEEGKQHATAEYAASLRRFASEHNFRAEEDAFGQSLISITKASQYRRYRKISVEITY